MNQSHTQKNVYITFTLRKTKCSKDETSNSRFIPTPVRAILFYHLALPERVNTFMAAIEILPSTKRESYTLHGGQ